MFISQILNVIADSGDTNSGGSRDHIPSLASNSENPSASVKMDFNFNLFAVMFELLFLFMKHFTHTPKETPLRRFFKDALRGKRKE